VENITNKPARKIELERKRTLKSVFLRWEWMLFLILLAVLFLNTQLSSDFLNYENIASTLKMFLDKGIVVLPMMMVLLIGEIDISVASIITLSGVCMGIAGQAGAPITVVILVGLAIGLLCGLFNGILIVKFSELSSTIITLGNMIFFRGIAYMILENRAYAKYPAEMKLFAWGSLLNIPVILYVFVIEAIIFAYVIHRTRYGRMLYAIGSNSTSSYFSGIKTNKIKISVYALTGLFSGLASVFLVSKLGSSRANMATGFEMEIIAMVILGGVSVSGGVGNVIGVVLSVFIIGMLRFGLGLANIASETVMIIIGSLLILSVAIPNFKRFIDESYLIKKLLLKFKKA